jgi:hypothetical protein
MSKTICNQDLHSRCELRHIPRQSVGHLNSGDNSAARRRNTLARFSPAC